MAERVCHTDSSQNLRMRTRAQLGEGISYGCGQVGIGYNHAYAERSEADEVIYSKRKTISDRFPGGEGGGPCAPARQPDRGERALYARRLADPVCCAALCVKRIRFGEGELLQILARSTPASGG